MSLIPFYDYVIVKSLKKEMSESGILIGSNSRLDSSVEKGKVVSVGAGRPLLSGELFPVPVQVGAEIIFKKLSSFEIEEGGEKFLVIRDSDIVAIIE